MSATRCLLIGFLIAFVQAAITAAGFATML